MYLIHYLAHYNKRAYTIFLCDGELTVIAQPGPNNPAVAVPTTDLVKSYGTMGLTLARGVRLVTKMELEVDKPELYMLLIKHLTRGTITFTKHPYTAEMTAANEELNELLVKDPYLNSLSKFGVSVPFWRPKEADRNYRKHAAINTTLGVFRTIVRPEIDVAVPEVGEVVPFTKMKRLNPENMDNWVELAGGGILFGDEWFNPSITMDATDDYLKLHAQVFGVAPEVTLSEFPAFKYRLSHDEMERVKEHIESQASEHRQACGSIKDSLGIKDYRVWYR